MGHGCRRLRTGLLRGPRVPLRPPRRLRHRLPRLPLARAGHVQLGARPLRRGGRRPGARRAAGAVDRRAGRVRGVLDLRRAGGAVQPGGQLAARVGSAARRPGHPHARQPGRAVGDPAGRDEARRGGHPRDHPAAGRGRRGPAGPGRRPARRRRRIGDRGVRRRRRRLHPHRGGRRAAGLAGLRRGGRGAGRLHAGRRHPRRRPAAALLHLRHHGAAQARRAHPRVLSGRAPVDDVLDRAGARRRAPQHLLAGLGEARLEQRLRAVERRGVRAGDELRAVRRRGGARRPRPLRGHQLLRAADGVADADPGRPDRPAAPARQGRRARASRSTPRSSSRSSGRGGYGSATGSARPRRPSRSPTRRASR